MSSLLRRRKYSACGKRRIACQMLNGDDGDHCRRWVGCLPRDTEVPDQTVTGICQASDLKSTRCRTVISHCNSRNTGVMCSHRRVPVMRCAATFWTDCNFLVRLSGRPYSVATWADSESWLSMRTPRSRAVSTINWLPVNFWIFAFSFTRCYRPISQEYR